MKEKAHLLAEERVLEVVIHTLIECAAEVPDSLLPPPLGPAHTPCRWYSPAPSLLGLPKKGKNVSLRSKREKGDEGGRVWEIIYI